MLRFVFLSLVCVAGLALAAEPGPVARVNGQAIPASQLDVLLKSALAKGGSDSDALRQQIRTELIAHELLRQAALKKKIQNDPVVVAAREAFVNRLMIERYIALTVRPATVSEADVRSRYERVIAGLGDQEYRLSVIVVASEHEARQILGQLQPSGQTGDRFADLARAHSLLANRGKGGRLDWVSFPVPLLSGQSGGLPLAVARAVFSVFDSLGSVPPATLLADPLAVDANFWIVRIDEVRPTQRPDYAAAAPGLRRVLESMALERAGAALMQGLVASARIE